MDYIFLSSIAGISIRHLNISYDIACQWSKNLSKRVENFPINMQESFQSTNVQFFVPKFHLPAHGDKCQGPYSLNLRPGVGRTDGEGIERGWSLVNPLATMLREMGPGFRHNTFDNHWSALNWKKITGLGNCCYPHDFCILTIIKGKSLRTKLKRAVINSIRHSEKHRKVSAAREDCTIVEWNTLIQAWLCSPFDCPNPFFDPPACEYTCMIVINTATLG